MVESPPELRFKVEVLGVCAGVAGWAPLLREKYYFVKVYKKFFREITITYLCVEGDRRLLVELVRLRTCLASILQRKNQNK